MKNFGQWLAMLDFHVLKVRNLNPISTPKGSRVQSSELMVHRTSLLCFLGGKRASRPLNSHYLVVRLHISRYLNISIQASLFNLSSHLHQVIRYYRQPLSQGGLQHFVIGGGGGGGGGQESHRHAWIHAPCMYTSHVLKCQRNYKNGPKYLLRSSCKVIKPCAI